MTDSRAKHRFRAESYTVPLNRNLALRIYRDSRPSNLEIAHLQKGLVLMLNGKELIEEGVGFGVPVVIFSDKTFFSRSSELSIIKKKNRKEFVKNFYMDTVSRKTWNNKVFIDNSFYQTFSRFLMSVYRKYPSSRRVIFPLIKIRNKLGINTYFIRGEHRGKIIVTYKIKHNSLHVEVDFSQIIKQNCTHVLLLNEQGSTFFRKYVDSNGVTLVNNEIGAWDYVTADWAYFSDLNHILAFCLKRHRKSRLIVGREYIKDRLSWSGIAYELPPHLDFFKYEIKIRGETTNG